MIFLEGYVKNDKDIYYNKDKFDSGEINLCFITGHSGSGKSTMARGMSNKDVEHYELDDVIANWNFSDSNLKEYGYLIYSFFKGPGRRFRYYSAEDVDNDPEWIGQDDLYERHLLSSFILYAESYAKSHKDKKFIIEGIWLYIYCKPEQLDKYAVYIKGTSALISRIRAVKRDSSDGTKKDELKLAMKQLKPSKLKLYILGEKDIKAWRRHFENLMD